MGNSSYPHLRPGKHVRVKGFHGLDGRIESITYHRSLNVKHVTVAWPVPGPGMQQVLRRHHPMTLEVTD